MDVAGYLVARLKEVGVRHVFAVPGDYASPFLIAVDADPGLERVATIGELGSGYAADGYARLRGVGAACVQYGVGTFSALNCVAGSFVERVPVVLISASPSRKDRTSEFGDSILYHHSTGDLEANRKVFASVTVAAEIISDADGASAQIDGALTAMLTQRRPVYIEVFQDVWTLACGHTGVPLRPHPEASDAGALSAWLEASWQRIALAERPVLWIGVQVQRYGLQDLVQELVDVSGLPFVTTTLGKTVLDERQPLFAGTYAGPASPEPTRALMDATDCPIALGTIVTDDYLGIMGRAYGAMVEVNDGEARVGYGRWHGVGLQDAVKGLLALARTERSFPRASTAAEKLLGPPGGRREDGTLTYERFYDRLAGYLSEANLIDEVVLVLGESASLYVFGNLMGLPRDAFVAQAAWGSLGHETGCALGVALGSGKRPFVIAGDGGFMMTCQELSSLAQARVNAVVFVVSNSAYAIEQAFVDLDAFQPDGVFARFDILPGWDYPALAKAFGARGYSVRAESELVAVLAELRYVENEPALVEVVVPAKDLPPQLARLAGGAGPGTRKYYRLGRGR